MRSFHAASRTRDDHRRVDAHTEHSSDDGEAVEIGQMARERDHIIVASHHHRDAFESGARDIHGEAGRAERWDDTLPGRSIVVNDQYSGDGTRGCRHR